MSGRDPLRQRGFTVDVEKDSSTMFIAPARLFRLIGRPDFLSPMGLTTFCLIARSGGTQQSTGEHQRAASVYLVVRLSLCDAVYPRRSHIQEVHHIVQPLTCPIPISRPIQYPRPCPCPCPRTFNVQRCGQLRLSESEAAGITRWGQSSHRWFEPPPVY